jgi:hypothetical protein
MTCGFQRFFLIFPQDVVALNPMAWIFNDLFKKLCVAIGTQFVGISNCW